MSAPSLTESLRETLALFEECGAPRTTTEVAELLDLGRRSTYERLERLVDHGHLETKKVGASARVWWQPPTASVPSHSPDAPDWLAATESLIDDVLDGAEVGVFVLNEAFEVAWINETTEQYFGLDRDEVLGRDKRTLVEERLAPMVDDPESFADRVLATYDDNSSTEQFECRVSAGDGRAARWLEHRSKPIESGVYAGGRVELYYDITERRAAERVQREGRLEFKSLVDAVDEYAIFRLDTEGSIQTWNSGAERLMGYEADEILGEHISTFYTEEDRAADVPKTNLARAAGGRAVEDEGWRVRADGTRFWANVTITAIRDDEGDLEGYAKVTRDMTERREHEEELRQQRDFTRQILETAPVGVLLVEPDGTFTAANQRANDLLDLDSESGESNPIGVNDVYDEDGELVPPDERPCIRALDTDESVRNRHVRVGLSNGGYRWLSTNIEPMVDENGAVERTLVTIEDVSQLKEQAERLARERDEIQSELEGVFERVEDAFYAVNEEFRFTYVNDLAEELLQADAEELLGESVWEVFPAATETPAWDAFHEAMETQEPTSYEVYFETLAFWVEANVYPSESGLSVYFRDVTERKGRERELTRYEMLIEESTDVNAILDRSGRFQYLTPSVERVLGHDPDELVGDRASEYIHPEDRADIESMFFETMQDADARPTHEFRFARADGSWATIEATGRNLLEDPTIDGIVVYTRDVTERKERERELQTRVRQQEVVTELGQRALEERDVDALMEEAARLVSETLGTDYCKVLDLDPDAAELLLRQGVGWEEGIVGSATVSAVEDDSQAAYTLAVDEPVRVEDLETETRFSGPELLTSHDVRSGISTIIGPVDDPWGILGTHGTERRTFSDHDVNFVQSVANILATAIERRDHEDALLQQREQLAALNNLNRVARDITDVIIDQSTREEIEETVCERLAATDSYLFAWVGEVDGASQTVNLRAEAGVEGYLDDVTISVDPDDEHSRGPTGRALRTGTIQTSQDIHNDSSLDPWREHVEAYNFRSSAAIPIVHDGTTYGVLNVYADRPRAFEGQEREVISQLGEIVGHAIAATERKQALLSDQVVELEFRIRDFFEALGVNVATDGRITFDETVLIQDGEYLVYGTATADAVETVSALVETVPYWKSVTFRDEDGDTSFQLRLSEPPVLSALASLGGSIEEATIEDGDYHTRIHLSPSVEARRLIDIVQDAYPMAEMVARRQLTRTDDTTQRLDTVLTETLTDRQQAALRAAYHAGFFEWPREATGEEIAESLDISAPTFSQHLRKAEKGIFESLFSSSAST